MRCIYLDCNSTAPLLPEAGSAMANAYAEGYANPASQHAEGRRAHRMLENVREEIARRLGADITGRHPDRLIFTSGGTEANNLALQLAVAQKRSEPGASNPADSPGSFAISAIEHPSVNGPAEQLSRAGWQIERLKVTQRGVLDLADLDERLVPPSVNGLHFASIMLANNETGVLQPVADAAGRCAKGGVLVHTDASQAVGKLSINFRELGVAAMTIAPHKFGGPRGIGALLVRHDVDIRPILYGGSQQLGLRPGTESVALPSGFLAALAAWDSRRDEWNGRMASLRDRFESKIREIYPSMVVNGSADRLPNTTNIAFVGHDRQALFMALDLAGICCSTGSACASGSSEPSPTLQGMNLPEEVISSSLRFSLSPSTSEEEIDEAVRRMGEIFSKKK